MTLYGLWYVWDEDIGDYSDYEAELFVCAFSTPELRQEFMDVAAPLLKDDRSSGWHPFDRSGKWRLTDFVVDQPQIDRPLQQMLDELTQRELVRKEESNKRQQAEKRRAEVLAKLSPEDRAALIR